MSPIGENGRLVVAVAPMSVCPARSQRPAWNNAAARLAGLAASLTDAAEPPVP